MEYSVDKLVEWKGETKSTCIWAEVLLYSVLTSTAKQSWTLTNLHKILTMMLFLISYFSFRFSLLV